MHVTSVALSALTLSSWMVSCSSKTSSHHGCISYDTQRQKRAGYVRGITSFKVIQSLLHGATELEPTGTTRQFVKNGNFMKASKDFLRTHAYDKELFRFPGGDRGISGKIGDGKIVMLRTSRKDGLPVIVVKTTGNGTTREQITHRIKYEGFKNNGINWN